VYYHVLFKLKLATSTLVFRNAPHFNILSRKNIDVRDFLGIKWPITCEFTLMKELRFTGNPGHTDCFGLRNTYGQRGLC
jgi:hypothetical protein